MCVTALVTLAITMIFKTSFTTNFAQGVISAFGAYAVASLMIDQGWSIWLALLVGMLVSMTIAVLVDVGIFRQGRYVNALGKQIITMGLISIVVGLLPLVFTISNPAIPKFIEGSITFAVGDSTVTVTNNALLCMAMTIVVIATVFILLRFSKWGLAVRATASNEYVAGMMGINTHVVTAISWGLAGAIGALAATINASTGVGMNAYYMTDYQIFAFLAGILGGFGTFYGPVIAALMIPLANKMVEYVVNVLGRPDLTRWSMVIVYAIALVVIFFRPQGIFGKKIARKV
jgi:branched-chain amino acid transport system permease protein